jgi:hypothetical protein
LLLSTRTKKLSPEVARLDTWLLQREARIASLEATIWELETMLRERETSVRDPGSLREYSEARQHEGRVAQRAHNLKPVFPVGAAWSWQNEPCTP